MKGILMAERSMEGELEQMLGSAQAPKSSKQVLAVDTYGTMVGGLNVKKINEAMFKYGQTHLGMSTEQLAQLEVRYKKDSKAPDYINDTDAYKAQLITLAREGKLELEFKPNFFADVPSFLETALNSGLNVVTLTKGGENLVKAFYNSPLPKPIQAGDRTLNTFGEVVPMVSTSSKEFKFQKKTDPRCYAEFLRKSEQSGITIRAYVTDDIEEAKAAKVAFDVYQRLKGIPIPVVHIPEEAHRQFIEHKKPLLVRGEDGIYQTNTLLTLFSIEELIQKREVQPLENGR